MEQPHYNTVEMTRRWAELTGTPEKEVTQRVKILRREKILPDSRTTRDKPLADWQIALFITASMCCEQHIDAPEALHRYAELPPKIDQSGAPIEGMRFGDRLASMLRRSRDPSDPWRIIEIHFIQSRPIVEMVIANWEKHEGGSIWFRDPADESESLPIERGCILSGRVIDGMGRA